MATYQIQIPEPCNEDWNKMPNSEKGKFCENCNKNVIDYTQTSNLELTRLIKNKSKICGRFKESQLNTDLIIQKKNPLQKIGFYFGLASFLGVSIPTMSQKKESKIKITQKKNKNSYLNNISKSLITIKGMVSDDAGPLPGVSVFLNKSNINTESNFDGHFFLEIDKNFINKNSSLTFKFIGYSTEEILINKILKSKNFNLVLKEDTSILDEIIAIAGGVCIVKKDSLFDKLRIIKTDSILNKLKLKNKNK